MRLRQSVFLVACTVLAPSVASADLAPPPGYVETCTVERQQGEGEECRLCTGAFHGNRTFCEGEYGSQGFTFRCRTRGASVWSEVWCAAPEVAAAYQAGGGTPAPQPGATTDTAAANVVPGGEGSGVLSGADPSADGSGTAEPATPPPAPPAEPAAPATDESPAGATQAGSEPESAPVETPGRRGCAAAGPMSLAVAWLPGVWIVGRRRRARSASAC